MESVTDTARDPLADLATLNAELARYGAQPVMSNAAAALYPPEDLPPLLAATRRHLMLVARSSAET